MSKKGSLRLSHCLVLAMALVSLLTLLIPVSLVRADSVVTFPDAVLEAAIREALTKPSGDIYASELLSLSGLNAWGGVADLAGLEFCINLTDLDLCNNNISDISPLAGLTSLTRLDLWGNHITDISPLAGLTSLTNLALGRNGISDISPLEGLTNLTLLYLWGNQISDISPLEGLTNLTELIMESNHISNIQPLVNNLGLSIGDVVDLRQNPLSTTSVNLYIPQLQARGVRVIWDNTPIGSPVIVNLTGAEVTFTSVTTQGVTDAIPFSNPGAPTPFNFTVRGQFVDITTTATYSGPITIGISYDPAGTSDPQNLRLFHWDGSQWVDATTSVDTGNHVVYGQVLYLSPFFIGDPASPAAGGCFIATAAYGTPMAKEIQVLRDFRDEYLLTNPVGKALVKFYYKTSPPIAEFITDHPALKPVVRAALRPAIAFSWVAVNATSAEKIAILGSLAIVSGALALWLTRRSRRLRRRLGD